MTEWILSNEPLLRLALFSGVFALMATWELIAERREFRQPRRKRWLANLGILVLDTVAVRLVFPATEVGFALYVESQGWGLLQATGLPFAASVLLGVLLLDLAIYLQHVMFHAVPALWRLHMVHHSDQDLDVTTGIRFHPAEIALSLVLKFIVIAAFGPPVLAVFLFAVLLNATSMFNHANVRLGTSVDRWLRWILVTPDMHRVHHSVERDETDTNFGFNLPWWDRLFGTYRAQPRAGHEGMQLGVSYLQQPRPRGLLSLLALPLARRRGEEEDRS